MLKFYIRIIDSNLTSIQNCKNNPNSDVLLLIKFLSYILLKLHKSNKFTYDFKLQELLIRKSVGRAGRLDLRQVRAAAELHTKCFG